MNLRNRRRILLSMLGLLGHYSIRAFAFLEPAAHGLLEVKSDSIAKLGTEFFERDPGRLSKG